MFKKIKAGIVNMANNINKSINESREKAQELVERKYEFVKRIANDIINGDGDKKLRRTAIYTIAAGVTMFIVSHIK